VRELIVLTADECKRVREERALCSRKRIEYSERFRTEYAKLQKECCYCGVTQGQIDLLFEQKKIYTKRQDTRGRRLELERLKPNESYENLDNLKLACYWCNNAKSDEFSMEEFKLIGEEIGKVLRARLVK
jgi:5-methylcytosine-specific restriction endonuclease McrA